ncbi:MAG TPA: RdgB/HAM1 family non-canonical purine NTP pyrophosphatase [Micropruina sp.]|nr:RdgB/HAM1 family non-canonical purine NTP pyrophosphatase [Micropruina sp.]
MKIVLATHNAKKLAELRRLVADQRLALDVLGLDDTTGYPEPAETERTFEGNALLKARACVAATGLPALADDSGIAVDLLNGMPGVRSARWAGAGATDQANLDLLIAQLADTDPADRTARFVCAMAYCAPDGTEHVIRAAMEGILVSAPAGANGFGYDPIFVAQGQNRTNAELSPAEKDAISHRGKAVRAMLAWLIDEGLASAERGSGAAVPGSASAGP